MADLAKQLSNIVSLFPAHIPVGSRFISGVDHKLWVERIAKRLAKKAEYLRGVISELLVSELVGCWDCLIAANSVFPLGENALVAFGDKLGKSDANLLLVWSWNWRRDHCFGSFRPASSMSSNETKISRCWSARGQTPVELLKSSTV